MLHAVTARNGTPEWTRALDPTAAVNKERIVLCFISLTMPQHYIRIVKFRKQKTSLCWFEFLIQSLTSMRNGTPEWTSLYCKKTDPYRRRE
jgi:lipopolysaccharide biosynthesis glycosyltransferase